MVDYALARRAMVDSQVNSASVTDPRLLKTIGLLPRERFVPAERRELAYIDDHHALGGGRYLAAPAVFARLAQLASISAEDSVLEIAAGTGYGTAVLAHLARDVCAVETDPDLAQTASANLADLGVENAIVFESETALADRRFDVIVVEAALDRDPDALLARLRPGGRLVALIRRGPMGVATRFLATGGAFKKEKHFDATLPLLAAPVVSDEEFVF